MLQSQKINEALQLKGADPSFLNVNFKDEIGKPCFQHTYNLKSRISAEKLIENYASRVKELQEGYKTQLEEANMHLFQNLPECLKADEILGTVEQETEANSAELNKLKDGTSQLKCPLLNCNTITYKLQRHLNSRHNLSEYQTTYALNLSRRMARATVTQMENKTSKSILSNTLASKKHNYKRCMICSKLYKNITDHAKKKHKLVPGTPEYVKVVYEAEVIAACYAKEVDGVR